jgi:hypothetical protein
MLPNSKQTAMQLSKTQNEAASVEAKGSKATPPAPRERDAWGLRISLFRQAPCAMAAARWSHLALAAFSQPSTPLLPAHLVAARRAPIFKDL